MERPNKSEKSLRRSIFYPALVIMILDFGLTLALQPRAYWEDFSQEIEKHFIGELLLAWHPIAFILGSILWIVIIYLLIHRLKKRWLALSIFLGLIIYHIWPAMNWVNDLSLRMLRGIESPGTRIGLAFVIENVCAIALIIWSARSISPFLKNNTP